LKIGEIEALYPQADLDLVHFVLDAGHAYHGGIDVPAFPRTRSTRIVGLPLRDHENDKLSTLGTGTFPVAQVADTIKQADWRGSVENEEEREDLSKNGVDVVAPSIQGDGIQGDEGCLHIVNRREFVYSSAAAAAVAARSLDARSYGAVPGANSRVGLGVIGTGRRATIVCEAFAQDPRVEFRALADIYDKQVAAFQGRFKDHVSQASVSVEYRKLLDRNDVDAVYIATPDHLHVEIAKDALAAGKNVYLEKPTLHRWSERETLARSAASSEGILQCGMQQRSGAHYLKAKQEYFEPGKLGRVLFARCVWHNFPWQRRTIPSEPKPQGLHWDLFLGPAPKVPFELSRYSSWRSYHDYGNGLLADILTHWADVAQWLMGDAQPVSAVALGGDFQLHGDLTNPDTVSAIVRYCRCAIRSLPSISKAPRALSISRARVTCSRPTAANRSRCRPPRTWSARTQETSSMPS
jgi:predicted dehydrogenase